MQLRGVELSLSEMFSDDWCTYYLKAMKKQDPSKGWNETTFPICENARKKAVEFHNILHMKHVWLDLLFSMFKSSLRTEISLSSTFIKVHNSMPTYYPF